MSKNNGIDKKRFEKTKFKLGDKVRICDNIEEIDSFPHSYAGKESVISEVFISSTNDEEFYRLESNSCGISSVMIWPARALEPIADSIVVNPKIVRFTSKDKNGTSCLILRCGDRSEWGVSEDRDNYSYSITGDAIDRFSAYEDFGLSPEQFASIDTMYADKCRENFELKSVWKKNEHCISQKRRDTAR